MSKTRTWIVRSTEIMVIDRSFRSDGHNVVTARIPITPLALAEIVKDADSIGGVVRGHVYDLGAADGVQLIISFSSAGPPNGNDLRLVNMWREEATPLVETISRIAGKEYAIEYPDLIRQMNIPSGSDQIPLTMQEYDRKWNRPLPREWWCIWPLFANPNTPATP